MKKVQDIRIFQNKKEFYTPEYPWALELIDKQNAVFWRFDETNISKDYQDLTTNLTKSELHGIKESLKLFTLYELDVGNDYWGGVVKKVFGHPEIKMLAVTNSYFEVVHARAYNEINKCLGLNTQEFYCQYKKDEVLSERIEFLENSCKLPKNWDALDVLKSLCTFFFIEGVVLYSSFAFIKSFNANGKNLLKNINAAIDYSIRDEGNFHVTSGEMLFKTVLEESELTSSEQRHLENFIYKIARKTYEHEEKIMDKLFSKGEIKGITENQLKTFIQERINECLNILGCEKIYLIKENKNISQWFYNNITTMKLTDFFVKQSAQYNRNWNKDRFRWKKE